MISNNEIDEEIIKIKEYMKDNSHKHFPDFVGMLFFGLYWVYLIIMKMVTKVTK